MNRASWALAGCGALAAVPCGFVVLMWVVLYKIKHDPVPPIPARVVRYTVSDIGAAPLFYWGDGGTELIAQPHRLSESGRVVTLSRSQVKDEAERSEAVSKSLSRKWKLAPGRPVQAMSGASTWALARGDRADQWQVWHRGHFNRRFDARPLGYTWRNWCFLDFHKVNERGQAIGNTLMATGCASSGGASEPHGRTIPLIYENGMVRDLNTLIRPGAWYVRGAIDLNERGQILCLGLRGTALRAESFSGTEHWLLLSPTKPTL